MADGSQRNTDSGDSVNVSCFYSNVGPSRIHVYPCHSLDLGSAWNSFQSTGMYNIFFLKKEIEWLMIFKERKQTHPKVIFRSNTLHIYVYLIIPRQIKVVQG